MGWILLLLVVAGCFWLYRELRCLEGEILTEIAQDKETRRSENAVTPSVPSQDVVNDEDSQQRRIVAFVASLPGCAQKEVYAHFSEIDRDNLQNLLRGMANDGLLRRERAGNSYRLYPV
ncbi:MAG: helix-turn-helix domain-containing protein [Desulfuromonadales bacterium]|nr:helix-turn-helix domain-containing protein [Desulfuromonadales bacterium]